MENPTKLLVRDITADEFGNFLSSKGITPECPLCKKDFAINVRDNDMAAITEYQVIKANADLTFSESSGDILAAASLMCENCGYIRTFGLNNILKWLSEQQS